MLGLTTVFYLNFVSSLTISVSSRAAGLNKSCLNENVAMSEIIACIDSVILISSYLA